jgi:phosphoribosylformylglycinamidine synthase
MAFSGNCSIDVVLPANDDIATLFNEEAGLVIEVANLDLAGVRDLYHSAGIPVVEIGKASPGNSIKIRVGDKLCVDDKTTTLRDVWESTSFQLEKRQRNPDCVAQEQEGLKFRKEPQWKLSFSPARTDPAILGAGTKHKVAILRQEGSNGDREMIAAFITSGFETWDVNVSDLLDGSVALDMFRGIVFVGGFSFADVLDSGKGWAAVIKFNESVYSQFEAFRKRTDTFSLGVCNGCQLMALLGWVPSTDGLPEDRQPRLLHNASGKFESRFVSVQVQPSPAVMLKVSCPQCF